MPKKFKRILNPLPKVAKPEALSKSQPDEWDIRPGETFREFNQRIKQGNQSKEGKVNEVGSGKNFKTRIAEEFAEARGLRTKRKEHLKKREEKKKMRYQDSDDEDVIMESVRFGETVMAPPVLKVKPKNCPKSTLRFKHKA